MKNSIKDLRTNSFTLWCLLLIFVVPVFTSGCGSRGAYVAVPFSPPEEFSDDGLWQRSEGEPSTADNQQIGGFFEQNPELVGSPEWTGTPEKYIAKGSSSDTRFYWFSGNEENPSWNALEFSGRSFRELSGVGVPGGNQPTY
jgi:hypothetical protein